MADEKTLQSFFPSISKTRCASRISTIRCRSSSARALPDVRDGLKPVHRRILYTMQQMGLAPNEATASAPASSATLWANTIRTANLAVYDALVRLAQDFTMRYPLVDGQGNFGSVDGDPPAADRYTEAQAGASRRRRCSKISTKRPSTFAPTTTTREVEPDVLPARIPNLLVNGSDGIAVGMATKIPPHNLTRNRRRHHHAGEQSRTPRSRKF